MTLGHRLLKRNNSPVKSPKLTNSSFRKKKLLRRLSNTVQFGAASKANLKVVVRIRPENQREIDNNATSVIDLVDDHMLIFDPNHDEDDFFFQGTKQKFRDLNKKHHKEQKFMFEKVFGPTSTNEEIFETTTKDIVSTVLNGYNYSVFAYGATGSGKTHTMIGSTECPGIAFLTVMELFRQIAELKESQTCEVGVSYLEVYNEMVYDLLAPGKTLNLHESGQQVQVRGLSLHKPQTADELLQILANGNRNRSQHPTDANAESSRSHAVFQVFVRQQEKSSDIKSNVSIAKLSMIDLAGSERGAATGFKGARFREGANINKSLLALGNCINALADGKSHIPYRDSKLTRLLKDSIGGNCRSVMIATVSPSSLTFEDTFNTLRYANRAKTIKTKIAKNSVVVDQHLSQYVKVVDDLKSEISVLKERLKKYEEKEVAEDLSASVSLVDKDREMYEQTILTLKQELEGRRALKEEEKCLEKEFLMRLTDFNCQLKNLQREILQLETSEREFQSKIHSNRVHLVRMKIFEFASSKIEKGVAKCERSIQSFQTHLEHIHRRKAFLREKLGHTKQAVITLYEEFKENSNPTDFEETPKIILDKVNQNELEQNVREMHQINEYLRNLVSSLVGDQTKTEKLLLLLLVAVKHFYLRQRMTKEFDPESAEFLENIFDMLDVSRIEWEDLKNTEDSFGEQTVSQYVSVEPKINVHSLVNFSMSTPFNLSPAVFDIMRMYKRSNIKTKPNVDLQESINGSGAMASSASVPKRVLNFNNLQNEGVCEESPQPQTNAENPGVISSSVDSSQTPPLNGTVPHSQEPSPNWIDSPLRAASLDTAPSEKKPSPQPSSEEVVSPVVSDCDALNSTITLEVHPLPFNTTFTPPSPVVSHREKGVNNVCHPSLVPSFPIVGPPQSETVPEDPVGGLSNAVFEGEGGHTTQGLEAVNSTFSVMPSPNIPTLQAYPASSPDDCCENITTIKNVLQTLPSLNDRNNGPAHKLVSKKSGPSLSSSKFSFSRLAPSNLQKQSFKKLSKSASVSVLPNTPARRTMTKSSSFLKPKVKSTTKNQENVPPKSVAFGSTIYLNQRDGDSKRHLHFPPPPTTTSDQ